MNPLLPMHSLPHLLQHLDEAEFLLEKGDALPPGVPQPAWDAFLNLYDRAMDQVDGLVEHCLGAVESVLREHSVRHERRSRRTPSDKGWECETRLYAPRARSPFARIGVNIGAPSLVESPLTVSFSYLRGGSASGRALCERLRHQGVQTHLADGRPPFTTWSRGTVILGARAVTELATPQACGEFVSKSTRLLMSAWPEVLAVAP